MANAGPNTRRQPVLHHHRALTAPTSTGTRTYTIFGKIVEGLGVAQKIQALPIVDPAAAANGDLSGQRPEQAVYIDKVTIAKSG